MLPLCLLTCTAASCVGEHSSLVGLLLGVSEDRNSILCEFQSRRIDCAQALECLVVARLL